MNLVWLVRMARWARHPPSPGRVKLVLTVIALCFALYFIEYLWGWPDWLTVNGGGQAPETLTCWHRCILPQHQTCTTPVKRMNLMKRISQIVLGLGLIGGATFLVITQPQPTAGVAVAGLTGDASRGEAIFHATGCASCHMAPKAEGDAQMVLSGGQRFASAFGTFLAPNISSDAKAGIGGWSNEQFAVAIQDGISPEGQHYYPAMPYTAYTKMVPQDVVDLKSYMDTLPASDVASLPHEVGFPFNIRRSLGGWKFLFMSKDWVLADAATPEVERGRYIAEAMAHCGECHTARNPLGGLKTSVWMGGANDPSGQGKIPNVTPGALSWSSADIVEYLTSGFTPEFDSVGGHMAHVVENMSHLPESDRMAVAAYLAALPAVAK